MTLDCTGCAAPSDAPLCRPCTWKLTAILDDLPKWLAELRTTVTRMAKTSAPDGGKATKKFEQPIPLHPAAVELLDQAGRGITSWVTTTARTRGIAPPPMRQPAVTRTDVRVRVIRNRWRIERHVVELRAAASTPLTVALAWLAAHVDDVRQLDQAAEILTHARAMRDAIRRMVDNLGRRWAGPCTAQVVERHLEVITDGELISAAIIETPAGEPRECGADLRTRPGAKVITCGDCGATYDPIDRAQWILAKSVEHQAGARFIAEALTDAGWPVKENTVTQWARRGKLYAWRDDENGRPLYRVGDVLDLVNAARAEAGVTDRDTAGIPA